MSKSNPSTSSERNTERDTNAIKPPFSQRVLSKSALWLLRIIGSLPYTMMYILGSALGTLLYRLHSQARHTTETNFAIAFPDWPPERRLRMTHESLMHDCRLSLELTYLWTRPFVKGQALIREIRGEALLDLALADERGLLLILPHLGNWELTNHYLMAKTPLTALYKPLALPDVESVVRKARSLGETRMVPTTQAGVKELMRTLKTGGVSVILPDQSPPVGNGQFAPFFSVPTYTSPLVPKLLKKTGAHSLCIFTERLPHATGFIVHIEPVDLHLFAQDDATALHGLNASIEQCIKPRIPQYLWGYKRFKLRPDSGVNPYDYPDTPVIRCLDHD